MSCNQEGGGGGASDLSHCIHPPQAPGSPPPSDLLPGWSIFERERGREKEREKKVLLPCDLSPDPGQRLRSSPPYHIMALLCGAVLLCYSSSLVTVLHPWGSLTGAWGSQAWLLTAPRWKGLGRCPKPSMLHTPLAYGKLLGDFSQAPLGSPAGVKCLCVPGFRDII